MSFKILWSDDSVDDLQQILRFISKDSPKRSLEFGQKIIASTRRLMQFPESGRVVPELSEEIPTPREIIVGDCRIIYRLTEKVVRIDGISHARRLLQNL